MEEVKRRLRAHHPASLCGDRLTACDVLSTAYPADRNCPPGSTVARERERLAYPLSLFDTGDALPNEDELRTAFAEFTLHIQPGLQFWGLLPFQACSDVRRDAFLAAAVYGCLITRRHTSLELWSNAARVLMTHTFMDNRLSRSKDSVLTWLLLETFSTLTAEAEVWRQCDGYLGFLHSIARNALTSPTSHPNETWTSEAHSSLALALLLSSTVRSIHLGVPLLASRLLNRVVLEAPHGTIEDLILITLFGNANTTWPAASERSALLTLLVLLDQTIAWARDHLSIAVGVLEESETLKPHKLARRSSQLHAASSSMYTRLSRALARWKEMYFDRSEQPVRALFHYCSLLLSFPGLDVLPDMAGYPPRLEYSERLTESYTLLQQEFSLSDMQAPQHAWSILEAVTRCNEYSPIWVPCVTHAAGLFVWHNIMRQRQSREYGSLRVLKLFQDALERMSWPCCEVMAVHLESLSDGM